MIYLYTDITPLQTNNKSTSPHTRKPANIIIYQSHNIIIITRTPNLGRTLTNFVISFRLLDIFVLVLVFTFSMHMLERWLIANATFDTCLILPRQKSF